jgi:polygalacturonase
MSHSDQFRKKLFSLLPFLLLTCILSFSNVCYSQQTKCKSWKLAKIPTQEEVGASMLPKKILPVKAPFKTIKFKKPSFPVQSVKLALSPAGMNTSKIQQAIDELSQKGGGEIIVPAGNWLTGRIELKSNINLHFDDGATLSFSGEIVDFLPAVFTRSEGIEVMSLGACIYANGAKNIAITGKGRLIGPANGSIRSKEFLPPGYIDILFDPKSPVKERIADGKQNPWILLPMFISPINCDGVYIEGISLENTAFWNIVPVYCNNVIVRGVTINSVGIPRGDGINVDSSTNVLIEYNTLSCGDDCFTMKAGRGEDGLRVNKPTENVVLRYCLIKTGHGGITCGSETAAMIRNLYVHDCVFNDSGVGIRFKTYRPRGGGGENLTYERIRLTQMRVAFDWDMLGSTKYVGEFAKRLPAREVTELTPKYENIHAKNILIESTNSFVNAIGIPESPLRNVTIENVEVTCNKFFHARDMRNSIFKNIRVTGNDSVETLVDSKGVKFENVEFNIF